MAVFEPGRTVWISIFYTKSPWFLWRRKKENCTEPFKYNGLVEKFSGLPVLFLWLCAIQDDLAPLKRLGLTTKLLHSCKRIHCLQLNYSTSYQKEEYYSWKTNFKVAKQVLPDKKMQYWLEAEVHFFNWESNIPGQNHIKKIDVAFPTQKDVKRKKMNGAQST